MNPEYILFGLVIVFGFYMAWSIGANDVANAMGTSVGSGALTMRRAVIFAAILEFAGAFLVGTNVSNTVRKGIINPDIFVSEPMLLAYGMIASLLAAAVWLQLASYKGWPVSTTHTIVGAILGFGIAVGGLHAVYWNKVGSIVASWFVSPLMSGTISFLIFTLLRRKIFFSHNPVKATKKLTPYLVFFVFSILTLVMVFKGLKNLKLDLSLTHAIGLAVIVGIVAALISWQLVIRIHEDEDLAVEHHFQSPKVVNGIAKAKRHLELVKENATGEARYHIARVLGEVDMLSDMVEVVVHDEKSSDKFKTVEKIFVYLQILSACFVAFAHGSNDVANAIGPLAAAIGILKTGAITMKSAVPLWVLALGGCGIVVGLATWGWRVIETIGKKITELTPTRGFCAEFGAAITIVIASKFGLPISTTHTLVGGVLGVGLARGIGALNISTVRDIAISWLYTIPAGALMAVIFFYILRSIFG